MLCCCCYCYCCFAVVIVVFTASTLLLMLSPWMLSLLLLFDNWWTKRFFSRFRNFPIFFFPGQESCFASSSASCCFHQFELVSLKQVNHPSNTSSSSNSSAETREKKTRLLKINRLKKGRNYLGCQYVADLIAKALFFLHNHDSFFLCSKWLKAELNMSKNLSPLPPLFQTLVQQKCPLFVEKSSNT